MSPRLASYDVNSQDSKLRPRYNMIDTNSHGTRCAGEVTATANNSLCTVDVAYEESIGGVRILDGNITNAVEAHFLSPNPQHVDIYSDLWAPKDSDKTVDGPGKLSTRAFIEGVRPRDSSQVGFYSWLFMSVNMWGESPLGDWNKRSQTKELLRAL